MKVKEYNQMMSYLTRRKDPKPEVKETIEEDTTSEEVIEEIEEARTELKDIFDSLYEKEGRLDR